MASSTSSKALRSMSKNQRALRGKSHDSAPARASEVERKTSGSDASTIQRSNGELIHTFKSDLTNIRALVTCTICDQLLYEPWTLGCGHTYCYSCLSSWFVANKRNKTCPDCRQAVEKIPAPSFLIKQLIETFIVREELMPADESTAQHRARQTEENEIVDKDKSHPSGLFKGCFDAKKALTIDVADGVRRCPECLWEYEGGEYCEQCGVDLIDSDIDSLEDFSDERELDEEALEDAELYHMELEEGFMGRMGGLARDYHREIMRQEENMLNRISDSSEPEEDEDEETESMRDFVVHDDSGLPYVDENTYQESHSSSEPELSEDVSEENGIASRWRNRLQQSPSRYAPGSTIITLLSSDGSSDSDIHEDQFADTIDADEATLLNNGWSPLDHGNDSDNAAGRDPSEAGSDTETLGREPEEGEDEEDNSSRESTPRRRERGASSRHGQHQNFFELHGRRRRVPQPQLLSSDEEDQDDLEEEELSFRDNDGDVEMSVSPITSTSLDDDSESDTDVRQLRQTRSRSHRPAVHVHDLTGESSDESIRPAPRRRRQRALQWDRSERDYSPQISQLFRQYQSEVQDAVAQSVPVYTPNRRVTVASRPRGSRYRVFPPRRIENSVVREVAYTLDRQMH